LSSLKKQSKEVLQENTVISMSLVYEDGSKKVMNLEGQELSSKAARIDQVGIGRRSHVRGR
jgi:hypothetical protein